MEQPHFYQSFYNVTTLHPLGIIIIIILVIATMVVKRKYALYPMIVMVCFVASGQRIVVAGFDFNFLRILIIFTWARIIIKSESNNFYWKTFDKIFILWTIVGAISYVLLRRNLSSIILKLGNMFDLFGLYFIFRILVNKKEDVDNIIRGFILISIPVAVAFIIEKNTGRNVFSIFEGVPEITEIREGRLRCQGAFEHPIIAGIFWASLIPLIVARLWHSEYRKVFTIIGLFNSILIVILTASSTPIAALLFSIIGACMYPFRYKMKLVFWIIIGGLVCLHFIMKAPVWALIARVGVISGSTGYHRFFLIDQAIKRFNEWWLLGTISTDNWGWLLYDLTNEYIVVAVNGGILSLALFVIIIGISYRNVGRLLRNSIFSKEHTIFAWTIGISLFIHTMCFLAVGYFGQVIMVWYLTLAISNGVTLEKRITAQYKKSLNLSYGTIY